MTEILRVTGVSKYFGAKRALDGIDLTLRSGDMYTLLGPNGAGKTTTISMLTGILEPTSGTARIGGYSIKTDMAQAKKLNGLVPQDLALYPTLSARANLNFFGRIYGLEGKALKERVADVLQIVALTDRADEAVEKYSGGMKRRVNIAAGLVHQPRLLFLDEPTVGVDPQSRNHIFESVLRLNRERGMTIIYTSHYMEEVELLCSRVAIIDQGQIVALDTIKNLIDALGGGVINVGVEQADEELLRGIGSLPAVKEVVLASAPVAPPPAVGESPEAREREPVSTGAVMRILTQHSQEAVVSVIGYLNEKDRRLTSLEILEPNLETVFLTLTGKKLRE